MNDGLGPNHAQRLARAVRESPEMQALDADALLPRLRAMRPVIDERRRSTKTERAVVEADSGRAVTVDSRDVTRRIEDLTHALERLRDGGLDVARQPKLADSLRTLHAVIGSLLGPER